MPVIPPEIYDNIIKNSPRDNLLVLSEVSKTFNELCFRHKTKIHNKDHLIHAILNDDIFSIIHIKYGEYGGPYSDTDIDLVSEAIGRSGYLHMIHIVGLNFLRRFNTELAAREACRVGNLSFATTLIIGEELSKA